MIMSGGKRKATEPAPGGSAQFSVHEGPAEKRGVFLDGHCIFCLKKTSPGSQIPNKRPRTTDLLPTWQWTWTMVQRGCLDPRDLDTGEEEDLEEMQGSFRNVPPLCPQCTEQLVSLDRLLDQVAAHVGRLKRVVRESGKQYLNFRQSLRNSPNVTQDKMEKTLDFLAAFWSKFSTTKDAPDENTLNFDPSTRTGESPTEESAEGGEEDVITISDDEEDETKPSSIDASFGNSYDNSTDITIPSPGIVSNDAVVEEEKVVDLSFLGSTTTTNEEQILEDEEDEDDPLDSSDATSSTTDSSSSESEQSEPTSSELPVKVTCQRCGKVMFRRYFRNHMKTAHRVLIRGRLNWAQKPKAQPPSKIPKAQPPIKVPKAPKPKPEPRIPKTLCEICHSYIPRLELTTHMKDHVGQEEYLIRCLNPTCWFVSLTLTRMQNHMEKGGSCHKVATKSVEQYRESLNLCTVCGVQEKSLQSLRTHLAALHETAEKRYPCPLISKCGMTFTEKQSLKLHLCLGSADQHRIVSETATQFCPICKYSRNISVDKMAQHLKDIHEATEIFQCSHCPFQFSSREYLLSHLNVHRFEQLSCDICGVEEAEHFATHSELMNHYFKEHGIGSPCTCEHCGRTYWTERSLKHHIKDVHLDTSAKSVRPKERVKCSDCDKSFKDINYLRNHSIREHAGEPWPCEFCSETFATFRQINMHRLEVHKGVKQKKLEFRCEEPNCGATFPKKRYLQRHHSVAHLGERHVCEVCGKSYNNKKALHDHHKHVHLGIRDQVCEVCGEAFVSSTILKRHMLIHTGERPFACEICGQRFRQKEALKPHVESHQKKGDDFKPTGPMKHIRKRVQHKRKP